LIAVDTNILIYAHVSTFPKHGVARRALTELTEGGHPWALPVFCVGEFLRVVTHPGFLARPFSAKEALDALGRLEASPSLNILAPGERYMALLREAINESGTTGNLVFDAQIVALCRESGVHSLLSEDRDYNRFKAFPVTRLPTPASS